MTSSKTITTSLEAGWIALQIPSRRLRQWMLCHHIRGKKFMLTRPLWMLRVLKANMRTKCLQEQRSKCTLLFNFFEFIAKIWSFLGIFVCQHRKTEPSSRKTMRDRWWVTNDSIGTRVPTSTAGPESTANKTGMPRGIAATQPDWKTTTDGRCNQLRLRRKTSRHVFRRTIWRSRLGMDQ